VRECHDWHFHKHVRVRAHRTRLRSASATTVLRQTSMSIAVPGARPQSGASSSSRRPRPSCRYRSVPLRLRRPALSVLRKPRRLPRSLHHMASVLSLPLPFNPWRIHPRPRPRPRACALSCGRGITGLWDGENAGATSSSSLSAAAGASADGDEQIAAPKRRRHEKPFVQVDRPVPSLCSRLRRFLPPSSLHLVFQNSFLPQVFCSRPPPSPPSPSSFPFRCLVA